MQIWNRKVIVRHSLDYKYGPSPAYHADKQYPELSIFQEIDVRNSVFSGIRQLFVDAGFDSEHLGGPNWNPLSELIRPGMTVLLKPNLVRHFNDLEEDTLGTITHGSIIRAVTDYVYLALKGTGRIIIADSPQDDADFEMITALTGLKEIATYYMEKVGFRIEYLDLRQYETKKLDGVVVTKKNLSGDPRGYNIIDLGVSSAHSENEDYVDRFYGADYNTKELRSNHCPGVHKYCISQTVLDSDVVINLPKMKTHKKAGITVSMKNLIGINGNKNYLPHHTLGLPVFGGDQFATNSIKHLAEFYLLGLYKRAFKNNSKLLQNFSLPLKAAGRKVFGETDLSCIRSGNWIGNKTIWRTILDLNRILLFCNKNGHMTHSQQRTYLSIIDGVVGGEGNGPLACANKFSGFLVLGQNPLDADITAAYCMGFVPARIPILKESIDRNLLRFEHGDDARPEHILNGRSIQADVLLSQYSIPFKPHFGWNTITYECRSMAKPNAKND
jgi:uncharacterized protein (DUF362 family)